MSDRQFLVFVCMFLLVVSTSFSYSMVKTPKELRHGVMPGIHRMGEDIKITQREMFLNIIDRVTELERKVKSIDCIDYCIDNFARPIPNTY